MSSFCGHSIHILKTAQLFVGNCTVTPDESKKSHLHNHKANKANKKIKLLFNDNKLF